MAIDNGISWKRNFILSPELNAKIDHLDENEILHLDASISCNIHVPIKSERKSNDSDAKYSAKLARWREKARKRDELFDERSERFQRIVEIYGAVRDIYDYNDSFGAQIEITVRGLKDILRRLSPQWRPDIPGKYATIR